MASPNAFPQSADKKKPTSVDDPKDLNGGQTQAQQQKSAADGKTDNSHVTAGTDASAPTNTPQPSNAARESSEAQGDK